MLSEATLNLSRFDIIDPGLVGIKILLASSLMGACSFDRPSLPWLAHCLLPLLDKKAKALMMCITWLGVANLGCVVLGSGMHILH